MTDVYEWEFPEPNHLIDLERGGGVLRARTKEEKAGHGRKADFHELMVQITGYLYETLYDQKINNYDKSHIVGAQIQRYLDDYISNQMKEEKDRG